jgi:hypothetical protein
MAETLDFRPRPLTVRDLEPFCSTDPERSALQAPWSKDGYTYSADGRILVRVDRLPDVAENKDAPNPAGIFKQTARQDVAPLLPLTLPARVYRMCQLCGGSGWLFDLHPCELCDGTGGTEWEDVSVGLRGALFDRDYLEEIGPPDRFSEYIGEEVVLDKDMPLDLRALRAGSGRAQ